MKMMKRVLSLLLVMITLCSVNAIPAFAESTTGFDILSSSNYAKTFTISSTGKTIPYTNSNLSTRGTATYGASSSSYIDNSADELYILDVGCTNGTYWAYVSYPTSSKRVNAYIPLSAITSNNAGHTKTTSTGKFYCSLRENTSTSTSYYVAKGDTVYLIATSSSMYQILYPISNGKWRLAWCSASDYQKYCGSTGNSGNTESTTTISTAGSITSPVSGSFVRIRYSVNNRYLDIPAEGISNNGTQLQIWDYAPGNQNQIFQLTDTGHGWCITSLQSGKIIEVRNSSHDDCAQVAQWDKHNLACARWDIVKNSDGTVSFRNRESGKYLNVCGGGNAGNGTKMIQYHDDNTYAMRFLIEPVTISGYTTTAGTISSSKIKQEKDLSVRSWHPLNGLTRTMLEQDEIPEFDIKLPSGVEAFNTSVDAIGFVLSWICNSSEVTRIHVTEGSNGLVSIRYGTSIEQNRSGKKMSLAQMLTEAHSGEAAYVLWAASDADKCIRNWFGLTGNGKYSMEMSFGKVKYGDYGYTLIIEDGAIRQIPLIHSDSCYDIYYKENKQTYFVMDAADVLRDTKLPLADDEARIVMVQLVKNGYVK